MKSRNNQMESEYPEMQIHLLPRRESDSLMQSWNSRRLSSLSLKMRSWAAFRFDQSRVFQLLLKLISIRWKQGQIRSSYKKLPELHCLILIIDVIGVRNLFAKKLESNFKQILTSAITSVEQENRYSCWTDYLNS